MKNKINIKYPGQILNYVDTKEHLLELFNYITNLNNNQIKIKNLCKELLKVNKFKSENKVLRMLEETFDDTLNTILDIIGE